MADDNPPSGGGKGLSGTIDLPGIGPAKKKVVFAVAGAAAAYVVWRYYQASKAAADTAVPGDSNGDGFADGGVLPVVPGQDGPVGAGGGTSNQDNNTSDSYGFHGTTNSQWTQYASTQLSASDRWSYTDIVEALGQYLAGKPLTAAQQSIVQAAIAVAGQPPEGVHVIVPGGDVPITVAPSGLKATAVYSDTIDLTFNTVAGADHYLAYRSGAATNIGTTSSGYIRIGGLQPGTSYTFYVAAVSSGGKVGPRSAGASATTKATVLKAPTGLKVTQRTRTSVSLTWTKVPGADGYRAYHNKSGTNVGGTLDNKITIQGLQPNTKYVWHVAALDNHGKIGPSSGTVAGYTTK